MHNAYKKTGNGSASNSAIAHSLSSPHMVVSHD